MVQLEIFEETVHQCIVNVVIFPFILNDYKDEDITINLACCN